MPHYAIRLLTLVCVLGLASCNPAFDAAEKNNKNAINAGRDEVSSRLAIASEQAGDLASAERAYQQMVKNSGGSKETVTQLAGFYIRNGKSARAVTLLEPLHTNSPQDMGLLRTFANSLIGAGEPDRALTLLDGAIASHDSDAYLYNSRGVALDRLNRFAEAQASYRKAIAIAPEDEMDFKTNLGMSSILAGDYNDAIEILLPLTSAKNITPQARQNLALAYGLKGDMDSAMKYGSADLSIKEMNDNIKFYQLMAKNDGHSKQKPAILTPISSDAFPIMPAPVEQASNVPTPPSSNPALPPLLVAPQVKTSTSEPVPEAALNPSAGKNIPSHTDTDTENTSPPPVAQPIATPVQKAKHHSKNITVTPPDGDEEVSTASSAMESDADRAPIFEDKPLPTPELKPQQW